jgi:hypothetical protein
MSTFLTSTSSGQTVFCSLSHGTWNLGRRLFNSLKRDFATTEKVEQRNAKRIEIMKLNYKVPDPEPVCRILIYCGASVCAINTAQAILNGKGISEDFDLVIRIDDRIPTSCRAPTSAFNGLCAIRSQLDEVERSSFKPTRSIRAIDCPALERRIYALEQDDQAELDSQNATQTILDECSDNEADLKTLAVVIIAEAEIYENSFEEHPFIKLSGKPRASEIYNFGFKGSIEGRGRQYERKFMGQFHRSKLALETQQSRSRTAPAWSSHVDSTESMTDFTFPPTKRMRVEFSTS